jgi:hypothetical protein
LLVQVEMELHPPLPDHLLLVLVVEAAVAILETLVARGVRAAQEVVALDLLIQMELLEPLIREAAVAVAVSHLQLLLMAVQAALA